MGHVIEYRGDVIRNLSMGRTDDGLQHDHRRRRSRRPGRPDETTIDYVRGRPHARRRRLGRGGERWSELVTDDDAVFDKEVVIDGADIAPS